MRIMVIIRVRTEGDSAYRVLTNAVPAVVRVDSNGRGSDGEGGATFASPPFRAP